MIRLAQVIETFEADFLAQYRDRLSAEHLRALAWAHQDVLYDLLMRCAWQSVHTFSHNDRQLQGTPGAIAVLHTNTRRLNYHPHVHLVAPAAAIDAKQQRWRTKRFGKSKTRYLFNHKALAKVFRAKMLRAIEAAGLALPPRYPSAWVVDCKSVGSGHKALGYLGRYLYRGVIREKDIVACGEGQVAFVYRDAKTGAGCASATPTHALPMLRRRDGDRENTACVFALRQATRPHRHRASALTM